MILSSPITDTSYSKESSIFFFFPGESSLPFPPFVGLDSSLPTVPLLVPLTMGLSLMGEHPLLRGVVAVINDDKVFFTLGPYPALIRWLLSSFALLTRTWILEQMRMKQNMYAMRPV